MSTAASRWSGWAALAVVLAILAWLRPIDHDESQYVAAAVLTGHGLLPYRDYLYLQAPLQPLLFAPIAALAGRATWPALRLANAVLGATTLACTAGAARAAGAPRGIALATAGLMAACDIFLFSVGTARNDALPAACFAAALWLAMRADAGERPRGEAMLAGLLLAAAAAAKVSYAFPAAAYGTYALAVRRHRPGWLAAGALPIAAIVAWTAAEAPTGFWFGVFTFPAVAPSQYYWAVGRVAKLSLAAKAVDTLKFLALGPGLLALGVVALRRPPRRPTLLNWLIVACLVAALLPTPTWRQYLLPLLPPLFIRLAQHWTRQAPTRGQRVAAAVLVVAGLAPTGVALATAGTSMTTALRSGSALATAMTVAGVPRGDAVATLSPEFLAATGHPPDPRFAAGPFFFRSHALVPPAQEARLDAVSQDRLATMPLPRAVVVGGEGAWTNGDARLDGAMARWAVARGMTRHAVPGTSFTLYAAAP